MFDLSEEENLLHEPLYPKQGRGKPCVRGHMAGDDVCEEEHAGISQRRKQAIKAENAKTLSRKSSKP